MKYAPILIVTLNRYEHLERCISSLKKNKYAEDTDLYIGLDFPPSKKYEDGYLKIKEYLDRGISGFKSVYILKQEANRGPFKNFCDIQALAYVKHDRFIFTEDDNEFSPNYLEYINNCLEKYEYDDGILGISGYTYPIDTSDFDGNVFGCNSYVSAFGYAMWRKKEDDMRSCLNRSFFEKLYTDKKYINTLKKVSFNQYANMVKGMLGYTADLFYNGEIREVDLAFGLYMVALGLKMIYPVESKVRNWGYDGSGVNCGKLKFEDNEKITHRNFRFEMQHLDQNEEFQIIKETTNITISEVNKRLDGFFFNETKEKFRTDIAYIVSRILGMNRTRRIIGNNTLFEVKAE